MKPKHILFGLLALIAASCTNDDLNEVAGMKQNGIQVTAGLDANTRVGFEQDGDVTHAFWEEGDQITLYAPSQGALNYQVSTLGEGGYSATFSAIDDVLKNTDETIYAAHRAGMEADIVDGMATLPNTDTWTDEHPLPFAYAISNVADGKVNLSFQHIFAYLKLTLNAETVASSTNKSVAVIGVSTTSDEPLANVYGYFNIPEQEYVIEKGSNHMYFTLEEAFTATGTAEKSVYIPILPQPAGETITINIFGDYEANDILFTESKEVPSTGFVAGRAYTYSPKSSTVREGNTITLTEAGTLSQAISEAEKYTLTNLKIIGPLNGDDIRFIREMAGRDVWGSATDGRLTDLDISEASIVEGGNGYFFIGENDVFWTSDGVIGDYMFEGTILEKLFLPMDVTSIGAYAFEGCFSLQEVYCNASTSPTLDVSAFSGIPKRAFLHIPSSGFSSYMECGWTNYFSNIISEEGFFYHNFNDGDEHFFSWGADGTITEENGELKISNPTLVESWGFQMATDFNNNAFVTDSLYKLSMTIRGSVPGRISADLQIVDGYQIAGTFPDIIFDTGNQTLELTTVCFADGATRLIFNLGAYVGDIYIDDLSLIPLNANNVIPEPETEIVCIEEGAEEGFMSSIRSTINDSDYYYDTAVEYESKSGIELLDWEILPTATYEESYAISQYLEYFNTCVTQTQLYELVVFSGTRVEVELTQNYEERTIKVYRRFLDDSTHTEDVEIGYLIYREYTSCEISSTSYNLSDGEHGNGNGLGHGNAAENEDAGGGLIWE